MAISKPILGTTLYSLTSEYHDRDYSFEELVREVARRKLGPGLEVVGFQSIRGFPELSPEFVKRFRGLMDEVELVPSCLGLNADVKLRSDREMTSDEAAEYHVAQLEAAATLGFPIVRVQGFIVGPEVYEKLLPLAERLDVRMGIEIHAPQRVDSPEMLAFREAVERLDSPHLGFVPDFSSSSRSVPPNYTRYLASMGVRQSDIDFTIDYWTHEYPKGNHNFDAFSSSLEARGASPHAISLLNRLMSMFGRQPIEAWREIMHRVVHVHAKFYDVGDLENGSIDYRRVFEVFGEAGYAGHWSSEWEGHVYTDESGFENLDRKRALDNSILQSLGA